MVTKTDLRPPRRDAILELHDSRAERATLAALICSPSTAAPILARLVTRDDYWDDEIGQLVEATIRLHQAGKPIVDPIVLLAEWRAMGLSGTLVDEYQLAKMLNDDRSAVANTRYYAEIVRELSRKRKLVVLAKQLELKANEDSLETEEIIGWMDSQTLAIRHGAADGCQLLGSVMGEVIDDFESRMATGDAPALLSGFPKADEGGFVFAPGEMVVLAARTSMGKTTLATQIGMHHAQKGRPVLMASLEMKSTEVASRLLAVASGNNHQALRLGMIDQTTIGQMREAREAIGDTPFYLWSPGRVKAGQIHAMASLAKSSNKIQLLIVDLLNVVRFDDPNDIEHVGIGKVTKAIRDIAQQLQIPVLLVAQLNRGAEGEPPSLKHLKGSGEIEQDADVIAFLHAKQRNSEDVELIIAKNRFGAICTVPLKFIPRETRFADPSAEVRLNPNYRNDFEAWNNQ